MTAPYSARRAVQAEIRFPLKVSPKFPLARSLREQSPGSGLSPRLRHQAPTAGPATREGNLAMMGTQFSLQLDMPPPLIPVREPVLTHQPPPAAIASGEKSKARDIIAAIRTLKQIEEEQRPATPEEKQTLARFAGFGPVALSIFPDPFTGRYKDASWQALGEELKTLLNPGGIRQRQAHHLQRLLHLADRDCGHPRGDCPSGSAR